MGLASLLLLSMSSCAGRKYTAIDHRAYSKMPTEASSAIWRGIAKSNSYSSKNAFHGTWGGSGNHGGKPIDSMDEIFRRHDIVYYESRCGKHLKEADRALIKCLKAIDADTLNPQARKYRRIALNFMNSPMSYLVGKPLGVMMRNKEHENCYFTSPEVVTAFFETEHNGFPYAPEEKEEILTNVPQFLIADASLIHSHPTR